MRTAKLVVSTNSHPDDAYAAISRFEEYSKYVEDISSITVRHEQFLDDNRRSACSDWEVVFRNGPLRWTEIDQYRPVERHIAFEQQSGDFAIFKGSWNVESTTRGSQITFEVIFDFGIPSLAGVLEPIAERVLLENISTILFKTVNATVLTSQDIARRAADDELELASKISR